MGVSSEVKGVGINVRWGRENGYRSGIGGAKSVAWRIVDRRMGECREWEW